jgi:hypothetical protein
MIELRGIGLPLAGDDFRNFGVFFLSVFGLQVDMTEATDD